MRTRNKIEDQAQAYDVPLLPILERIEEKEILF